MKQLSRVEIEQLINTSERELEEPDMKAIHLWSKIKVTPELWNQNQYPFDEQFWVVGIIGNECLCFNPVEYGWGWGKFHTWGIIEDGHCQDLELHHVVFQTLFSIENN